MQTSQTNGSTHIMGCIYDNKSEIYWQPHLFRSPADFVRQIQMEAKNDKSMLNKFPSDYELYIVGEWQETEGVIDYSKRRLGSVLDLCPLS